MASEEKILDELHFLSWKIDALERKLETSLAIQEDLAASLLLEDSSSAASAIAIKKYDRRHVYGSSCTEPISSDDGRSSPNFDGKSFKSMQKELERSYLIIPVGTYKENDTYSFPSEKQTFTWSEMDDNTCKYISTEDAFNSEKNIANNLYANERNANKSDISNTLISFSNQTTPLSQSRFVASEKQMCTQPNGNDSEIMHLEDCLLDSSGSHSIAYDPFEEQRKVAGVFDIEHSEDDKMVSTEIKTTLSSNCRYGLTIGIATAKGSSQGIMSNDTSSSSKVDKRDDRYLEHSERFKPHFSADKPKEQRAVTEKLRPLLKESTAQSTHSSDEETFDRICNHSSKSLYCDNVLTQYKQGPSEISSDINACYNEKDNQPAYNVIYVDSESSEGDQTDYNFVDAYSPDAICFERNLGSLNANFDVQSSLANTAPDRQRVLADYPLLVKNGEYESDVYFTQKMKPYQKGNQRFEQNDIDSDAESKLLIEMQMTSISEEQRYYSPKQFDAANRLVHNGHDDSKESGTWNYDIPPQNVNNNGETEMTALYRENETKPTLQEVNGHISQLGDRVYGIVGYSDDYKAINTDSGDTAGVHNVRSQTSPVHLGYEQITQNQDRRLRTNSRKEGLQIIQKRSEKHLDKKALDNDIQSNFPLDMDILTESGFSETLLSALSDDVFFTAAPNPDSEYKTLSDNANLVDKATKFEKSESESPFSSLTSISSNNEQIYNWRLPTDSLSLRNEYVDNTQFAIPADSSCERNKQGSSALSYIKDKESSSDSEPPMRSFRLSSPRPRPVRKPSRHDQLLSDIVPLECTVRPLRVASPTSSVETSDLSMIDSLCDCQYQCECQSGIPSVEDFREELKSIAKYVLNARNESASFYKKPRARYFLDDEQGDLEIFDGRPQKKENETVPMLVRVILRLRKHFFGTLQSKRPYTAKNPGDFNNSETDSLNQQRGQTSNRKQRSRMISFSPSAMLLSAIGENSAAEVKEVIEKENIDVNQLSPSGRSLLHKAATAGDLESIYTLIQYGAVVNIQDQDGFPPIHSALRKAHFKCAILLIECGTDMARYTTERVREFLEIKHMRTAHLPVRLKTIL